MLRLAVGNLFTSEADVAQAYAPPGGLGRSSSPISRCRRRDPGSRRPQTLHGSHAWGRYTIGLRHPGSACVENPKPTPRDQISQRYHPAPGRIRPPNRIASKTGRGPLPIRWNRRGPDGGLGHSRSHNGRHDGGPVVLRPARCLRLQRFRTPALMARRHARAPQKWAHHARSIRHGPSRAACARPDTTGTIRKNAAQCGAPTPGKKLPGERLEDFAQAEPGPGSSACPDSGLRKNASPTRWNICRNSSGMSSGIRRVRDSDRTGEDEPKPKETLR